MRTMRTMRAAVVAIGACVVAACGPKHHAPPPPAPIDAAAAPAVIDAPAMAAEPGPLTREECVALIDHELEVGMADQRARKSADLVPTADQVAALRAKLVAEQVDPCLAMPRAQWTCAMAATTQEALYACAKAE